MRSFGSSFSRLWLVVAAAAPALAQEPPPPAPPPAVATAPGPLEALERAVCDVVDRVRPSVVQVTLRRGPADAVATSGIVWSADGHVVSLGRAFESADALEIVLSSGEKRAADLLGTDEETGIALLKLDVAGLREPLRAAPLGSSARLRPGSIAISISNPFGLPGSAALGTIAGRDRIVRRGRLALTDVLQITTPVNPGDPGGALADVRGEVVGIVASTYERPIVDPETFAKVSAELQKVGETLLGKDAQESVRKAVETLVASSRARGPAEARYAGTLAPFAGQGIGFAIPIDQARAVVERLKTEGKVVRGWLGVDVTTLEALDPMLRAHLAPAVERGVIVVGVREASPAERGGLRRYDVVVRYAGRDVADARELKRLVLETPPGRAVTVDVVRGGERRAVEVTPVARASWPASEPQKGGDRP